MERVAKTHNIIVHMQITNIVRIKVIDHTNTYSKKWLTTLIPIQKCLSKKKTLKKNPKKIP